MHVNFLGVWYTSYYHNDKTIRDTVLHTQFKYFQDTACQAYNDNLLEYT